jgi:MoxR-like ATPase
VADARGHEGGANQGAARDVERAVAAVRDAAERVRARVARSFVGQDAVVEELLVALFAGGHVLLEGAPGLGKTTLVRTLSEALDLSFRRVQCTPDLMPADVLGTRILDEDERGGRRFRFEQGPVFTHVLLADEINRATPRTQSALLEAMAERQVTIFGETHALEEPFLLVATQNPIEMEGTYPLPEAQLDRFLLKIDVGAPSFDALMSILKLGGATVERGQAVMTRAELLAARELVRELPVSADMLALAARIVLATSPTDPSAPDSIRRFVRWGASPRGAQALIAAGRARALLAGRLFVSVEDVERLVPSVLRHRLLLNYEADSAGVRSDDLARECFERARRS